MRCFLKYKRQLFYGAACSCAALLMCSTLRADTVLNLGLGNSAINGYPAPYGSVTVHLTDSTHATITFAGAAHDGKVYLMGGDGAAGVNVSGDFSYVANSFSASGPTSPLGLFTAPSLANSDPIAAGSEDGFGDFDLSIKLFDGFTNAANSISFSVKADNTNSWNSSNDVLTPNPGGHNEAAAHIFVWDGTSNGALATGYAGNSGGGGAIVPLPATASMSIVLLSAAAGFGVVRRLRNGPAVAV